MKPILLQAAALAAAAVLVITGLLWLTAGHRRMPILPVADTRPLELPQAGQPLVLRWEPAAGVTHYEVEVIEASTGLPALCGLTAETSWSPPVETSNLLDRNRNWLWRVSPGDGK
jgi:hypothetical protein